MTLDPKLRDALVCPVTKGPLIYDEAAQELISNAAKLAFPIRDGMPIMLLAEARFFAALLKPQASTLGQIKLWISP